MSVEVESKQVSSPVQGSLQKTQDLEFEEWRKKVRTRVTTLKCHVMASQGLTDDGKVVEPYSPDILLEKEPHCNCISVTSEDELDSYIQVGMAKLAAKAVHNYCNTPDKPVDIEDVHFSMDLENSPTAMMVPLSSTDSTAEVSNHSISENIVDDKEKATDTLQFRHIYSSTHNDSCNAQAPSEDSYINYSHYTDGKDYDLIKEELLKQCQEVEKLSKIRDEVENELQDLTANLFQEAHNMVLGANQRAAIAEKSLKEANMQVEVLQAEVAALKTLVITSTPSSPNPHLHPQIISKGAQAIAEAGKIFHRGHKKSPSDFDLKYGRDTTPPSSPLKESKLHYDNSASSNGFPLDPECWEVDPVLHREFIAWRQNPELCRDNPFMSRAYAEDIDLCLTFPNSTLAHKVQVAIEENALFIEEVNPRQKNNCPKKCVLFDVPRYCKYRFRLGDKDDTWYYISQLARNRIIAVCDFLNYLRYIQLGLVKSSIHDVYWEIVKLRRQMAMARLGF